MPFKCKSPEVHKKQTAVQQCVKTKQERSLSLVLSVRVGYSGGNALVDVCGEDAWERRERRCLVGNKAWRVEAKMLRRIANGTQRRKAKQAGQSQTRSAVLLAVASR